MRGVAAIGHELQPLAVADEMARDHRLLQQHLMRRLLVVEAEAVLVEADRADAGRDADIIVAALERRHTPRRIIDGIGGILRERMQNVSQHQFLVLLLVMQPDLDDRNDLLQRRRIRALQQPRHRGIDVGTIGRDLLDGRARDQAALRTGVPRAGRHIIGVEQEAEPRVEFAIVGVVRLQQERLEEPGGVGAMPFDRARIGHRLHVLVFRR